MGNGVSIRWIRRGCIAAAAMVVIGCGEEGSEEVAAASSLTSNRAPWISGSPPTSVVAGQSYSFVPTAGDDNGDALSFGGDAVPAWLRLDPVTGALSGTPGAGDAGTYRGVTIWVSDGAATTLLPAFDLTVVPASRANNQGPVISGSPAGSVIIGDFYDFVPIASDPEGDTLTFAIADRPSWASFDVATGRLSGTPAVEDVGIYQNVIINVTDGLLSAALTPFVIVVNPPPSANSPPAIGGSPPPSVLAGDPYSFRPSASDADGDTLSFVIFNQPGWATFDSASGTLAGVPGEGDVGEYPDITIVVRDGTASSALPAFSIAVEGRNSAPQISGTPATTATVGSLYSFTPTASDADGDMLTFSVVNRPSWASFDVNTGRLRGTPGAADAGSYAGIGIDVTDGIETVSLATFAISVVADNSPPQISGTPPASVVAGSVYTFTPVASDADGDVLTFSITNRPLWASFDPGSGRLAGAPAAGDVGTYGGVTISVSDGTDTAQLFAFDITVLPLATGSATLSWTPPTENTDGSALTDLTGYSVHWGTSPGIYTQSVIVNNPGISSYVVDNLLPGTVYYFAVRARNQGGFSSDFSNESATIVQ